MLHTCTVIIAHEGFVVLYSAVAAARDLSSVYVAPVGIYTRSRTSRRRDRPISNRPYAEPCENMVTDIGSPL